MEELNEFEILAMENKLRYRLRKDGFLLRKSRSRNPFVPGRQQYFIVDFNNAVVAGGFGYGAPYTININDVEAFINE
jgi:hypothetical protein